MITTVDLFPILTNQTLLENQNDQAFKSIIKDLKTQIVASTKDFNNVYQAVVDNYAEYVQSLPNLEHNNFNFTKGQLLLALLRTSISLHTADDFPCPATNRTLTALEQEKRMAIWQFAVFSSSLILDIGQAITSFDIHTCNAQRDNLIQWQPLSGPMSVHITVHSNTHYQYKILATQHKSYTKQITLLLAKSIIPEHLFNWLCSDHEIFIEWLALLDNEASGTGTLFKLLEISLQKLFNLYTRGSLPKEVLKLIPIHLQTKLEYHKNSFWKGVEYSLRGDHVKTDTIMQNNDAIAGTAFLTWLRDGIADGSISVNQDDSYVHISPDGVFLLNPDVFVTFCKHYPSYQNWLTVFKQFNKLGITGFSNDYNIKQANFKKLDQNQIRRGIIVNDPKNIFGDTIVPPLSSALNPGSVEHMRISAIFPVAGTIAQNILDNQKPKPSGNQ